MSREQYSELYLEYLLGQLPDEQKSEFEAHLADCDECRLALADLEKSLYELPSALPQHDPPAGVRETLAQQIGAATQQPESDRRGFGGWRNWAIAAGVAALLMGAGLIYEARQVWVRDQQIAQLRMENATLQRSNRLLIDKLGELAQPGLRFASLQAQEGFERVTGSAFVDESRGSARILIRNLPPLPPDSRYQLWIIEPGQPPHPSELFTPDLLGVTEVTAPIPAGAGRVATVAVTVEPAAGSTSPTGNMVFFGNLSE